MKQTIILLLLITFLTPKFQYAQKGETTAAIAAGVLSIGAAIASIEQVKEGLELAAVQEVLKNYPDLIDFRLSTNAFNGVKLKDLSNVGVVTFEITNASNNEKFVLFGFSSNGWVNENGVNFSEIIWKNFDKIEWNRLMQAYVKTASKTTIPLDAIQTVKIVNKGVMAGSRYLIEFDKLKGDSYQTSDYSEDFKIVFNEKSLGLFLKKTSDLVQISKKAIIKGHRHINNEK